MWRRDELKDLAKHHLKDKYWIAFVVSLIVSILGTGSNIFSWRYTFHQNNNNQSNNFYDFFSTQGWRSFFNANPFRGYEYGIFTGAFIFIAILAICVAALGLAYRIFVGPVISAGGMRWFSRSRESLAVPSVGQVFSLFRNGCYLKTVGSMLWMNLFLFLWGLLAAIPVIAGLIWGGIQMAYNGFFNRYALNSGSWEAFFNQNVWTLVGASLIVVFGSLLCGIPVIIKSYSYRMTPWIIADNPKIGYKRALNLSMALTQNQKGEMFILDLSFVGWFLLGLLCCGVGVLFVIPYYQAVQAELYARLRQDAADRGLCTMEELGYTRMSSTGGL